MLFRRSPQIIDFHSHIGRSIGGAERTVEKLIDDMKQFGASRSVVFPIDERNPGPSYARPNRRIVECVRQYPRQLIGFVRLNPNQPDAAFEQIEYAAANGIRGVKLHPSSDHFGVLETESLFPVIERNKLRVILHTDHIARCHPSRWYHIFQRHPKLTFILAHAGKDRYREAIEVAKSCPNVYLDTSTLSYFRTGVILRTAGARKVVFASDVPYSHLGLEIKKFEYLMSSHANGRLVFEENAKRVLDL